MARRVSVRIPSIEDPVVLALSVTCPDPAHLGSRVVRAGTYGSHGQRRQLLKCVPLAGTPHRFAEPLPRGVLLPGDACAECLNPLHPHQGPPHPRGHEFSARLVATALLEAAEGENYQGIGELVRNSAGRTRRNRRKGKPKSTGRLNGNLVSDWVESFAPGLWALHGPTTWPETIVIDELILNGRSQTDRQRAKKMYPESSKADPEQRPPAGDPAAGKKKGGRRLFVIIGAQGYPAGEGARPWLFQAAPSGTWPAFARFFRSLEGRPQVIVGDAGHAWQFAAREVWPAPATPEIVISEFHVRQMIDGHIRRLKTPDGDPLWSMAWEALKGPDEWRTMMAAFHAVADDSLRRWLKSWEHQIEVQLTRHAFRSVSRSTGGVEQVLKKVEKRVADRRWLFANLERMNRLLLLMTLDMRGYIEPRDWAHSLREWLMPRRGRPLGQRLILDRAGSSSLRFTSPTK